MTAEQQPAAAPVGPWLSPKQAGIRAGRHERTVREALHEYQRTNGKSGLRGSQRGPNCTWRIDINDVDAWVRGEKPKRLRSAS